MYMHEEFCEQYVRNPRKTPEHTDPGISLRTLTHGSPKTFTSHLRGVAALNLPVVALDGVFEAGSGDELGDVEVDAGLDSLAHARGDGEVGGLLEEELEVVMRVGGGLCGRLGPAIR